VIPMVTVDNIYRVPLSLEESGIGDLLTESLKLTPTQDPAKGLNNWRDFVSKIVKPKPSLRIGLVGKYVELEDAYLSVKESLMHAALSEGWGVEIEWISSEGLEKGSEIERLQGLDGIVVPGGFGYRGIEGKIVAAHYARTHKLPYLGLCLGMQVLCIELAREVLGSDEPNSTEFDISTQVPIIDLMPDQRDIAEMGGTMRLGIYPCSLVPGTQAEAAYEACDVSNPANERHRHRFEFNNTYRELLQDAGLVISGQSPDGRLVEIVEIADHPFMMGSQFHPEFKSRPNKPHPLFLAFAQAAIAEHKRLDLSRNGAVAGLHGQDSGEQDSVERSPAGSEG
jgi:CTP synthase